MQRFTLQSMWKSMWRQSIFLILCLSFIISIDSSSEESNILFDNVAKKYAGRSVPDLCGDNAPEWMRDSRICDRVIEDVVRAEYGHLGNALQTAKNANSTTKTFFIYLFLI